jgi:thymidine phosphorylase
VTKKVKKKTFKNRNIDEVIEGLENGTLPGVSINAVIKHIGVGSCFM